MTTLADLVDNVRVDILQDTASTQLFTDYAITVFLNHGIQLSFPRCFVYVTDTSTTTTQTTGINTYTDREYSLPSGVPTYPQKMPLYRVDEGPVGGQRISDSLQFTDRYSCVTGGGRTNPAWTIDWSRRKLILRRIPSYDTSGVYRYYLRLSYVRPVTQFTLPASRSSAITGSQTLEGPDALVPALLAYCQQQAAWFREQGAFTDAERLQSIGSVARQGTEAFSKIMMEHGVRMTWPQVLQ